ncbi:MAG: glycosyltransferase family 2 protein [Flavobacteriales bacterium]|jgi:dolichol-phosphate mannosyltransferase|nr:glycosyltransferase family 2 protein [Flavobacteriales bacterium]
MDISVVVPVYNGEKTIPVLVEQVANELNKLDLKFEIILVDDRGPDNSWQVIDQICEEYSYVKGVQLSRNFGQHPAISAGLTYCEGTYIVVMDCDLQDRPDQIPKLYKHITNTNKDIVLAQRVQRQDKFFKRMSSKYFYLALSYFTNTNQDASVANFGIYKRKAIEEVIKMGDQVKFFPLFIRWVGFEIDYLEVEHSSREEGKSNYTFRKLWNLALDNIISFSNKPLYMTVNVGLFVTFLSFLGMIIIFAKYALGEIEVLGYTSLMVTISFFLGIIIFILGIIGIYIAKIFDQVKGRQVYIVKEEKNI